MDKVSKFSALPRFTEERDFKFDDSPSPAQRFKSITLKGRLEFRKDLMVILYAASQTPGIIGLHFNDFEVEITWLSEGIAPNGEKLDFWEDTQEHIAHFVKLVKDMPDFLCFSELGLATHVFWESLKPISHYDGKRDGLWGEE
jgi:hypothetical protein